MEREKGEFKEKSGQRQDDRQHPQRLGKKLGQPCHDIREISGMGHAVEVAHAVEHDPRRNGAEKKIFHRRFNLRPCLGLSERNDGIEAERGDLQTDDDGDKLDRADQDHQAQRGKPEKHEKFRQVFHLVLFLEHENDERKSGGKQYLEYLREKVDLVGPGEQSAPCARTGKCHEETHQRKDPGRGKKGNLFLPHRQEEKENGKQKHVKFWKQRHRVSPLLG